MAAVAMVIATTVCAAPAQAEPRRFDVSPQPLEQALRRLADQGKVQVLFSGDQVRGHVGAAVSGTLEPETAFRRLLIPSGLSIRRIDRRTFVVVSPPPPVAVAARQPAPERPPETREPVREIVVVGQRPNLLTRRPDPDRFDATLQAAQATAIMSRTDLERTAARNVTEALSVLPGVTVLSTGRSFIGGVDSASRAEGMFTAFRGLNTEFNLNMIDGVALAQGLPNSRGVQLNLLPPLGFQSIVLTKAPTPDMDGDVISAAIDFRTPSAQDFRTREHLSLTVAGHDNGRAAAYDEDGGGVGIGVEYARRFGRDDRFGLYFSHSQERRRFANSEMAGIMSAQNDDGWAFARSDSAKGDNPAGVDPETNLTLTSLNAGVSTGESRGRYHVLTLDGRLENGWEVWLRGTAAMTHTEQNSTHSQMVGRDLSWKDDGSGVYRLSVGSLSTRVWYETNPDYAAVSAVTLGGRREFGRWTLSPSVFYSQGRSDRPDHIEASVRIDQVDRFNTGHRRPFSGPSILYAGDWPVPQFTPDVFADLDDAAHRLLARRAGQLISQTSRQTRQGFRFDADYRPDGGALRTVSFGVKYSTSAREVTDRNWTNGYFADLLGRGGLTWTDLGLITGAYEEAFPGRFGWRLPKVDHDRLVDYFHHLVTPQSFDTCGALAVNNANCNAQKGRESVSAAYVTAGFGQGRLEVLPGLRYEQTQIDNSFWIMEGGTAQPTVQETEGQWGHSRTAYTIWLPSLRLNYRPDPDRVYRLALWRGYARPPFMLLGGGQRYQTSDDGIAFLRRGNPVLKPVTANNLDLSVQGRTEGGVQYVLGAYYKGLNDYLFENAGDVNSGLYGPEGDLRIVTPRNGGRGRVQGLEAEGQKSWPMSGGELKLGFTLSRQWTRVDLGSDEFGRNAPIQNAPDWLAGVTATYQRRNATVTLIGHHTGRYLASYDALDAPGDWDNIWVRPATRFDLQADWRLTPRARVSLSAVNLTGAYSYWAHVGKRSLALSDIIDSGRRISISLRYDY
ncbi:TonB-dependent receptor [Asticcacaulis sp. AND118]|uniref:TonB-dependent receptor n=1 Tax=Asticcacaulis sp. AND118 TaxID=2840468 RepID=UPI001CFFEECF|nr:TonB-dependent receptor [Asticcacaulis sp. AND118]UDF05230.1 TonB-dependent receptor [Asticcacaulis sp. AND118]